MIRILMIGVLLRMTSYGIREQRKIRKRQNMIHVQKVGEFQLMLS